MIRTRIPCQYLALLVVVVGITSTPCNCSELSPPPQPSNTDRIATIGDLVARVPLLNRLTAALFPPHDANAAAPAAVESARQRVTIDGNGVGFQFRLSDVAGLMRAFLWAAVLLIMTEIHVFPIFTLSYKDVFCDYFTGDCEGRYGVPRFEPEVENYFVVDKKKTMYLNEKNILAGQKPPFPLASGYEKLDVFPPLKGRPEPALAFEDPIFGPATPAAAAVAPSDAAGAGAAPAASQRRVGFWTDEVLEQAKRDPPDSLNGIIMNLADKAYNFISFSYRVFGWMFD